MKKKWIAVFLTIPMMLSTASCGLNSTQTSSNEMVKKLNLNTDSKEATSYTSGVNSALYSMLDFKDTREYDNAVRGLINAPEVLELKDKDGNVVWSQEAYSFLDDYEKSPDTVNPSLWENTKNNHAYGLFEVCNGIYQVRGYDMANMTVIKGNTGWILYDTLMSSECAQAAMQLIEKNLGSYPIKAIIHSHCHADHFGGILGVVNKNDIADSNLSIEEQIASGKIPIIVPEGFSEHAVSENVYAGVAMNRRAQYQYGTLLEPSISGTLSQGIGMGQSIGTVGYIAPTWEIKNSGEKFSIDGIEMEFQITPGSEAPAEMNTWFPQFKALWLAENCTGTMHNLYTLRGTEVRDGAVWANYITESITRYGKDVNLVFQSHNWPHWGNEEAINYMTNTAAVYKFINDQTLTYINQGYTSDEISNMIELPDDLAKVWYTRQYYGTLSHNAKAVYQKYMGWYDANPVNLNPMTPSESAKKWIEYLGDIDKVLLMAKEDYEKGNYQWVAEITNTIVYTDPSNEAARLLCADALEQLGYQSESGAWRNAYLTGALELRKGNQAKSARSVTINDSIFMELTPKMMFDYMSIMMDKQSLADQNFKINVKLIDVGSQYVLHVKNGVLLVYENAYDENAQATLTCPKNALLYILTNNTKGIATLPVEGDASLLTLLANNMNQFKLNEFTFNVIEP